MHPILASGQSLQPRQSIVSDNQNWSLWMQTDGNVVLYSGQSSEDGQAVWATHTGPGQFTPRGLDMQTDGNLVLYDTSNQPRWASNTSGNPGAFLWMQNDGNAVIYRAGTTQEIANNALWATGTNISPNVTGGFIPADIGDLIGSEGEGVEPEFKR